ncbi:DNA topoisomerase I [Candidatus Kaiserbacteria bacterium RIFCSPHIGHO2_02_FULL_49_34]|uniref:DNA topoisomerase 1 n=1 Tax=Candidatus Kaiserbacteria bacterium RIFCSPHIGHO2_02_FULL_49_34 TaxID=1798491 RepID=A0A1F6DI56_9BACT|nr:MAG: DNA topoisomerase I [Candidatus Kaiserbacteria bacterium RIFCSPHIGHO2_02_FULL_49_34]
MTTLVIVESPAKAKTIEKYLGPGFMVRSSIGHVRDLPKSEKEAIDIPAGFVPQYVVSPGKQKVISELRTLAKKADKVILAADPDREGEAIAWHVAELLKDAQPNMERVTFNEITKPAIEEAMQHPRGVDMQMKAAQEARRVLDRLVGYDLSGIIWKKVRYGLSAGRVQSPALRILMEREREIRAFIPETFYVLTADVQSANAGNFIVTCVEEPRDLKEAERILDAARTKKWSVQKVSETEAKRAPYAPFITSTLQQVASTRLGFASSRTMRAAQKLYEQGHITYMRTDSTNLSKIALGQILGFVEKEYGEKYVQSRTFKTKSKNAQEAHEAVRPTNITKESAGLTGDEQELYKLIRARTIASQMADAKILRTKIVTNVSGATIPDFTVNGSQVVFDGWLKADPRARGEDTEVPSVSSGDALSLIKADSETKQTQPPSRYTEAGLIKELEKRGIGRPSTYASIIQTLVDREYVLKEGRTLMPTDTGDVVSSFLEEHFPTYISDTFTADMEDKLDDIANGEREYVKTLSEFYTPFRAAVDAKQDIPKATTLGDSEFPCPKCGAAMVVKLGKNGKFLSCSTYPDCDGARMIDGSEIKASEPIGFHPETGEAIYLLSGKFGPYVQQGEMPELPKGRSKAALEARKNIVMPKRASVPKGKKVSEVTFDDALHYLVLPRTLGAHAETGLEIVANIGRFGPYLAYNGEFRSLKKGDDPYTITLERAVEILATPKPGRKGESVVKDLGLHPRTKKPVIVYESKSGRFLRRGLKRFNIPSEVNMDTFTLEDALAYMSVK